jgi:hypothetical protein
MESRDDQVVFKYTRSIKQSKKTKRKTNSRTLRIESFIPSNSAKNVVTFIHTSGNVEETFNPLGVSLGASFESR